MGKLALTVNGRPAEVEVVEDGGEIRVRLGEHWRTAELQRTNQSGLYSMLIDGRSWEIFVRERPGGFEILLRNQMYDVGVGRGRRDESTAESAGTWTLTSPMSGLVTEVRVQPGEEVQAGNVLLVIESMKMNNELTAARSGTVTEVQVSAGERVERGRTLIQVM